MLANQWGSSAICHLNQIIHYLLYIRRPCLCVAIQEARQIAVPDVDAVDAGRAKDGGRILNRLRGFDLDKDSSSSFASLRYDSDSFI